MTRTETSSDPQLDEHDVAVAEAIVQGKSLEEAGVTTAFLLKVASAPGLAILYQKARELSSYALEEEALGRLRAAVASGNATSTQLRALDLLVQQLRWSSIKRNPNVFSEKAAINVTVPIQINTSLDLGMGEVGAGTKEFPNIYETVATLHKEVPIEDVKDHLPPLSDEEARPLERADGTSSPSIRQEGYQTEEAGGLRGTDAVEGQSISYPIERDSPEGVAEVVRKTPRKAKRVSPRIPAKVQSAQEGTT